MSSDSALDDGSRVPGPVRHLLRRNPVVVAVLLVTAIALVLRLVALGDRVAHWDEGRVAYWIVDFALTGNYHYRPIIHGPFLHHVNNVLFAIFGATDASMRLAPAVVGGLLPLSALLLRDRLRGPEVVGAALFLAVNPVFLYYSRFMRGDALVGAFMFLGFALFVRAIDVFEPDELEFEATANALASRRVQALVVAGFAAVALGFTVKENALAYLAAWIGALALVFDVRLHTARFTDGLQEVFVSRVRASARGLVAVLPGVVVGVVAFFVIIVFFYAPRGGGAGQVGLWQAFADPALVPKVVGEATVGSWKAFYGQWVGGGVNDHPYLPYLGDLAATMLYGGLAVGLLGTVGFLLDRYGADRHRSIVAFCFFWGFASMLGYPLITDIKAPWAAVHVVLPLAVPAGVAVGTLWDLVDEARVAGDEIGVALAAVLALLVTAQVGFAVANGVYLHPQSPDNEMVQYAQPAGKLGPTIEDMERAAAAHDGIDVVLYGEFFYEPSGGGALERRPTCAAWFNALPLPWYFERPAYRGQRMNVTCTKNNTQIHPIFEGPRGEDPPVVIARAEHTDELNESFPQYELHVYKIRTTDTRTAFYVDTDR